MKEQAPRIVLGLVLALGLWLRTAGLANPSFWIDEYFHVFAAQSILATGESRLPDGATYDRAAPITYLVAASFDLFGVSEATARLPSALLGTVVILVTYLIGRRWIGTWPAVLAAAFVATSPAMVSTARLARMYSLFQLLYLLALYAYDRAFERTETPLPRRVTWGVGFVLSAAFGFYIHRLTFNLGVALLVFWVVLALRDWRSRHGLYLVGALAGLALLDLGGVVDLRASFEEAVGGQRWATPWKDYTHLYIDWWGAVYPWVWWVSAPAAVFVCVRYGTLGFFLVCQFAVPFLLHSFVFPVKQLRYISQLFPILALMVSPFLVWGVGTAARMLARYRPTWRTISPLQRALLGVAAVQIAIVIVAAAMAPSIHASLSLQAEELHPEWRRAFATLAEAAQPGDAVVTVLPHAAAYYLPAHGVRLVRPRAAEPSPDPTAAGVEGWVRWYPYWDLDATPDDLRALVAANERGWFVTDVVRFGSPLTVSPATRQYIESHLEPHPFPSAGTVLVYRWGNP